MHTFRFRAETALQFRRRQHDHAVGAQGLAERALIEAERAVDAATDEVRALDARLTDAMRSTVAASELQWHVAWRARCTGERERLEALRQQRRIELEQARQQVRESYRRVRSLERLRQHALLDWTRLVQLEERKTMDALAASQFVRRKDD